MNKLVGPKTVIDCYSFIDALSTYGFADYAQGRYYNDPNVLYDEAHANEAQNHQELLVLEAGMYLICAYLYTTSPP